MDVIGAISTVSASIDLIKKLNDVDRQMDEADLKMIIVELKGSLFEAKSVMLEIKQALDEKDHEILRLKKALEKQNELIEFNGFHYRKNLEGKPKGRPMCPICLSKDGLQIMLAQPIEGVKTLTCNSCGLTDTANIFPE